MAQNLMRPNVLFRLATVNDLPDIQRIIDEARVLLARDGIPQWQGPYPDLDTIREDIDREWSYVLDIDGHAVATSTLGQEPDPNYAELLSGQWAPGSDTPYAAIHRTAITSGYRGHHLSRNLFCGLIDEAWRLGYRQLRIDTHQLNARMRHIIDEHGFRYAGVVFVRGNRNDQRNVYQKFL